MSSKEAETTRDVRVLVSFYAVREDSCVSNERLHKEKVCVPLNEGIKKILSDFKSHVESVAFHKDLRGFAGVKP